jgi:ribonucleoside-triphosphate reductase
MEEMENARLLTVYDAGFISMKKQYLTIWINGLAEAAESKGIKVWNNELYKKYVQDTLKVIYDENKKAKEEGVQLKWEI